MTHSKLKKTVRYIIRNGVMKRLKKQLAEAGNNGALERVGGDTDPIYVPNADNLGRCFDITKVDPFTLTDDLNQTAFYLWDDEGNGTVDYGMEYKSSNYGEYSNLVKRIYHAHSLEESFAKTVTAGGGVPGFCTFSASTTFKSTEKETTEKERMYTFTDFVVKTDDLDIQYDLYVLPLNDTFRMLVNNLPNEYAGNEAKFENFIAQCGTHFSSGVTFGGRAYQRIFITNDSYEKMVSEGIDIDVEVSGTFKSVTGNVGYSSSSEVNETFTKETSSTQESVVYIGGNDFTSLGDWNKTVKDAPMPINMTFVLISELLNADYFPEEENIEAKRSAMEEAVDNYLNGITLTNMENLLKDGVDLGIKWNGSRLNGQKLNYCLSLLKEDSKDLSFSKLDEVLEDTQTWTIMRVQPTEDRVEGGDQFIYSPRDYDDRNGREQQADNKDIAAEVIRYGDLITLENKLLSENGEEYTIGENSDNHIATMKKNGSTFKIWSGLDPKQEDDALAGRAIAFGDSIALIEVEENLNLVGLTEVPYDGINWAPLKQIYYYSDQIADDFSDGWPERTNYDFSWTPIKVDAE